MDFKNLFIASAFALCASFTAAHAVTFSILDSAKQGDAAIAGFASADRFGTNWGAGVTSTVTEVGPGSDGGVYRSPWQGIDGDATGKFYSVGGDGQNNPATVTFNNGPISYIDLLVGSIDSYNKFEFNDGTTITGTNILTALGFPDDDVNPELVALIRFNGENDGINWIKFSSSSAALEFAVSPVPLPAGGLLLLTGFGALALRRRRKAA